MRRNLIPPRELEEYRLQSDKKNWQRIVRTRGWYEDSIARLVDGYQSQVDYTRELHNDMTRMGGVLDGVIDNLGAVLAHPTTRKLQRVRK